MLGGPFHYDENVETPDASVIRIKQVARLLGYGRSASIRSIQKYSTK